LGRFVRFNGEESQKGDVLLERKLVIGFDELRILRDVAAGATAKVSLGEWRKTRVAVKCFFSLGEGDRDSLVQECGVHHGLRHPNVLQLLAVLAEPLCIVTEWMKRGSLFAVLNNSTLQVSWPLRLALGLGAARGVFYLHSLGLLHRDLKSKNILVDGDWNAKVGDFGVTTTVATMHTAAVVGTLLWVAPEVFEQSGRYGKPADVYSFGIILWELWTRAIPYAFNKDVSGSGLEIMRYVQGGGRPAFGAHECPTWLKELIQRCDCLHIARFMLDVTASRCWAQDVDSRPDMDSIVTTLTSHLAEEQGGRVTGREMSGEAQLHTPLLGNEF